MTVTLRNTKGSQLTHTELDANFTTLQAADTAAAAALAASTGASLVGITQSGTGAVSEAVQAALRRIVYPEQYGAVGDGVTDDSTAWQNAINTGKQVVGSRSATYLLTGLTVSTKSQLIDFGGALLRLKAAGSWILKSIDVDNIEIKNARLDMNSVANAKGIWHNGGWNLTVDNISSNDLLANTVASSYEIYIDVGTRGAYVSSYNNIAIKQPKIVGTLMASNAVTTISFRNLQCTNGAPDIREAFGINFYSPVIQNTTSAFILKNCSSITSYGGDIEGAITNLIDASAGGVSDVSIIGPNCAVSTILGSISGRFRFEPFGNAAWQLQGSISPVTTNTVDGIYQTTLLPAGAGVTGGRLVHSGTVGTVNATGVIWEYVSVNSIGPLVGRYALRVNHGGQLLETMVILNDQISVGNNPGDPTADIDTKGSTLRLRTSRTPASPTATAVLGEFCADAAFLYEATGANTWRRVPLLNTVSADRGDAGATLTVGSSDKTAYWNTALTAGRTVTLSTTGVWNGDEFHVVRSAASTGAFNLDVGGLKNLTAGQWCDVQYNGTAWVLTRFGSL